MTQTIKPQAELIAALAATMTEGMWADDILIRCRQIEKALEEIRRVAMSRVGGDR